WPAGAVARDEFGDIGVGDGDEVAARRIERVEEEPGLAGDRPALAREQLLAPVREVAKEREVEELLALAVELVEDARLVLAQPLHRLVEGVHRLERMQLRVGDDADPKRA